MRTGNKALHKIRPEHQRCFTSSSDMPRASISTAIQSHFCKNYPYLNPFHIHVRSESNVTGWSSGPSKMSPNFCLDHIWIRNFVKIWIYENYKFLNQKRKTLWFLNRRGKCNWEHIGLCLIFNSISPLCWFHLSDWAWYQLLILPNIKSAF